MALSWNEIKDCALKFSKEWESESREGGGLMLSPASICQ